MPLYVGDYLKDTRRLSTLEHGAYLLLIMEYWISGGLPNDENQLARVAGLTPAEWKKVRPSIVPYFQDGWRHKRVEEELRVSAGAYERRAVAGKQGGIAKAKLASERSKANGEYVAKR